MKSRSALLSALLALLCASAARAEDAANRPNPAKSEKAAREEKRKLRGVDCERGISCPIISRPPAKPTPVKKPDEK